MNNPPDPLITDGLKKVYRRTGTPWVRIAWEDMKVGDKVIILDEINGQLQMALMQITNTDAINDDGVSNLVAGNPLDCADLGLKAGVIGGSLCGD